MHDREDDDWDEDEWDEHDRNEDDRDGDDREYHNKNNRAIQMLDGHGADFVEYKHVNGKHGD